MQAIKRSLLTILPSLGKTQLRQLGLCTELIDHIGYYLVAWSGLRPISLSQPLFSLPRQLLPRPGLYVVPSSSLATVMASLGKLRSGIPSMAFRGGEVSDPGEIVLALRVG